MKIRLYYSPTGDYAEIDLECVPRVGETVLLGEPPFDGELCVIERIEHVAVPVTVECDAPGGRRAVSTGRTLTPYLYATPVAS